MRIAWWKFCSAISTVSPYRSFSSLILVMVCETRIGASPTEGSSTSRSLGEDISARPIASICCWPPESEPASWRLRSARTGKISKEKARFLPISGRAALRKAPSRRFSSTLSLGNRRRPSGTMATPRLTISSVDRRVRSWVFPSRSRLTEPRVGRTMPMMHFMSVLLPLPLVPSSAIVSPWRIPMETPCSARTAPYPASIPEILRSSAKVGSLHVRILDDPGRRALADDPAGVEADGLQDAQRLSMRIGIVEADDVPQGHDQVLQHRHAVERARDLEAAGDAAPRALVGRQARDLLAAEHDRAGLVAQRAGDAVDERGLARAVGADEAEALAFGHLETDLRQRGEAAEVLRHAFYLEERSSHLSFFNNPRTPSGAATTNTTSSTPTTRTLISLEIVTVTICCTEPRRIAPITG